MRSYPVLLCLALALNGVRLAAGAARPSGSPSTRPSRAAAATDRVTAVLFAAVNAIAAALVWVWPDVGLLLLAWATTVAIAATVGSVWVNAQVASVDDFYRIAAPVSDAPGELLRVGAYEGETPAGSTSLRILYSTLRADGSPAVASAVVAIPTAPAPSTGRTMLAWQHGTTGVARSCAPSLETNALSEYAIPGISRMIERGWIVVATDYPGMGTDGRYPYLIGAGEGQSTLTLTDLTHPAGSVFAEAAASRCATDPGTLVTLLVTLGLGGRDDLYDLDLDDGPVHDRLAENIATGVVPAPLFLG